MQQAALSRRKRLIGELLHFVVCLRKSAESAGDTVVSCLQID